MVEVHPLRLLHPHVKVLDQWVVHQVLHNVVQVVAEPLLEQYSELVVCHER